MLNWKQYKDRPLVAVHRGYHGGNILPNTVESVRAALAAADIAEIDISYVGGECFVFHDGEESRMFGFLTNLERMTPEAVRRLRYANKYGCLIDHPVNTLDEILEAAAGGYVNIDRCWKSAEEVAAVVGIVKKHGMLDKAVFKSTANLPAISRTSRSSIWSSRVPWTISAGRKPYGRLPVRNCCLRPPTVRARWSRTAGRKGISPGATPLCSTTERC